jgi:hypothetical protein
MSIARNTNVVFNIFWFVFLAATKVLEARGTSLFSSEDLIVASGVCQQGITETYSQYRKRSHFQKDDILLSLI